MLSQPDNEDLVVVKASFADADADRRRFRFWRENCWYSFDSCGEVHLMAGCRLQLPPSQLAFGSNSVIESALLLAKLDDDDDDDFNYATTQVTQVAVDARSE